MNNTNSEEIYIGTEYGIEIIPKSQSTYNDVVRATYKLYKKNQYDASTLLEAYESTLIKDPIRYFNYNNEYICRTIKCNNRSVYSIFELEETDERYINIIKFINLEELQNKNLYEIDSDLFEELNSVLHPLIKTKYGYYPVHQFDIVSKYYNFYEE